MGHDMKNWLFDPSLSYQENLEHGPFGDFHKQTKYKNIGDPQYDFFGTKVYSPFGIAAGPLPQANFVAAALDRGFDIVTFKTVRSHVYPCHPQPNVVPLDIATLTALNLSKSIKTKTSFDSPITIANSFGIPSFEPEVWQAEIKKSFAILSRGQALLVAFQGTVNHHANHQAFIDDHVEGVGKLVDIGATLIEINLGCPNEGHSDLLCFDVHTTKEIVRALANTYPTTQFLVKLAYFDNDAHLKEFIKQIGPFVAGITAINTVAANIVDQNGVQAFPGTPSRHVAGVSGAAIKPFAVDMVKRIKKHREALGYSFKIIGIGGVLTPQDFHDHRRAGADFVMGLTGVMWNPELASEIKKSLK
jgi:dihydroorotate dehydrogenase (NAD+) catalytic subunit